MSLAYVDYEIACPAERAQPHPVALAAQSRVIADSAELGWRDAFASLTTRRAWAGRIDPLPHLGIGYCLRGVAHVDRRIEGKATERIEFSARRLAILPTHAPAFFDVKGDADVLVVYLRGGMVRAVADRLYGASTRPLHFEPLAGFSDALLEQLCLAFAEALHERRRDDARYVDQIAETAAAHCLTRYPFGHPAPSRPAMGVEAALARVSAYVDEHLDGDLSVEALAEAARLTAAALKRAFAETHGETPKQWVIRRRLGAAQDMLAKTDWPLAEIALRAGFASQSHLCVMFKREIGRTPNEYRRVR